MNDNHADTAKTVRFLMFLFVGLGIALSLAAIGFLVYASIVNSQGSSLNGGTITVGVVLMLFLLLPAVGFSLPIFIKKNTEPKLCATMSVLNAVYNVVFVVVFAIILLVFFLIGSLATGLGTAFNNIGQSASSSVSSSVSSSASSSSGSGSTVDVFASILNETAIFFAVIFGLLYFVSVIFKISFSYAFVKGDDKKRTVYLVFLIISNAMWFLFALVTGFVFRWLVPFLPLGGLAVGFYQLANDIGLFFGPKKPDLTNPDQGEKKEPETLENPPKA
jgi:hypothetical protein